MRHWRMLALLFDGEAARVAEVPRPTPGAGYVLVRVRAAGVCSTDLQIVRGYMAFRGVLGHELVGDVVEGPGDLVGQRVVGEINFACRACPVCSSGLERHCPTRKVMGILGADGALAELCAVPAANLHRVDARIDDEAAVFVEPLAAAFEILEQIHVVPKTRCIVLGDGKLGLLVALVLHRAGARVIAVGRHRSKLAHLEHAGIETVHAPSGAVDVAPAEVVVEATGTELGLDQAILLSRPRGKLVLKSTVAPGPDTAGAAARRAASLARVVIDEITVVGSRCGSFEPALRALADGSIDVAGLVAERFPLEQADRALARAAEPGALKVVVRSSPRPATGGL